jgi:hypothetical protein
VTAVAVHRSAAASLLVHRETVACGALTASVAGLLLAFGPAPGDAGIHLYRTLLVRDGAPVWDNFWYAGSFPLASYSLLYYLPAALLGNLPLVLAGAVASTMLFSAIAAREWGAAAVWPARAFAVFAAAPLFTGLYSYSLGFAALLGSVLAAQRRRPWAAVLLAVATLGFSPLAFAFLGLVLASILAARRRLSASAAILGAGMLALAGLEVAVLHAFPSGGAYPFHLVNLAGVVAVCVLGALLARRTESGRPLLAFFVLWGTTSLLVWARASPVGGNWTRLDEVVFPVMLVTASLARFRPRPLAVAALAGALAYSLVPPLLLVPYRLDSRPAAAAFWQPALAFLARHARPGFRVEVVPTAAHWESYWIPRGGFALARGWYRQLDVADNPVLYSPRLDAATYVRWLRSVAVDYVLLPATKLDPVGGPREARLLRSNPAGLRPVARGRTWTMYRLADPTPLLTGPGRSRVTAFGHTRIAGAARRPGRYLLRVHFNPFWRTSPNVCVRRATRGMTYLEVREPGRFSLEVVPLGEALLRALGGGAGCRSVA